MSLICLARRLTLLCVRDHYIYIVHSFPYLIHLSYYLYVSRITFRSRYMILYLILAMCFLHSVFSSALSRVRSLIIYLILSLSILLTLHLALARSLSA